MVTLCSYHRRSNVAIRKEWTVDVYCASFINSKSATVELADEIPEAPDRQGFGVSGTHWNTRFLIWGILVQEDQATVTGWRSADKRHKPTA
jgi:hypothetical protein